MQKLATAWAEVSSVKKEELQRSAVQANDLRFHATLDQKEKERLVGHYRSKMSKMVKANILKCKQHGGLYYNQLNANVACKSCWLYAIAK